MNALVLVIGGGGRLGRALSALGAEPLSRAEADVTGSVHALSDALFERASGTSRPCFVVNAAALTDVSRCEADTGWSSAVNFHGAHVAALACAVARLPLVHVSTDYVFGARPEGGPYAVTDPVCPGTVYGRHKANAEDAVLAVSGWVARMSFLPSPFEHARAFSGVLSNREWVESAAQRLLRLVRAVKLRPSAVPRVVHLVTRRPVDLADLVRSRFPEVPAVPVEEGAAGLPFMYPRDTRLSGAWEFGW